MRRSRFTEEQIILILAEHDAGVRTKELCRKHGISDATFYKWKAKYGGMTVSETARLRTLEDENRRLKKLLVEAVVDNSVLKDLLRKTEIACGSVCDSEARDRGSWVSGTSGLQADRS
jgi:putative transposase